MPNVPLRVDFELGGMMAVPERHAPLLDAILLARLEQRLPLPFRPDVIPVASIAEESWTDGTFCWLASALHIEWTGPVADRILHRNARPLELLEDRGGSRRNERRSGPRTYQDDAQANRHQTGHIGVCMVHGRQGGRRGAAVRHAGDWRTPTPRAGPGAFCERGGGCTGISHGVVAAVAGAPCARSVSRQETARCRPRLSSLLGS